MLYAQMRTQERLAMWSCDVQEVFDHKFEEVLTNWMLADA